ncbi:MAG: RNA polymerase sigma factor [Limisphaerales bacterium]
MEFLKRLKSGDPDGYDEAYRRLHPVAFEAARSRLGSDFRTECEDIAVETLTDILQRGADVESDEGLKPLAAAIARNKATDRLRRFLAEKRGGNRVESLDALLESGAAEPNRDSPDGFLDPLTVVELRDLLMSLSDHVKVEYRIVLRDHYFNQLSHKEIAEKRRIAVGSVGVFIQRGLAAMRATIDRTPKIKAELLDLIGDAGVVRVLLPLLSAVQIGGWFFDQLTRFSIGKLGKAEPDDLPDEVRLQLSREDLPAAVSLPEQKRHALMSLTRQKYPQQFHEWELRKAAERENRTAAEAAWRQRQASRLGRKRIAIILLWSALAASAVLAVFLLLLKTSVLQK